MSEQTARPKVTRVYQNHPIDSTRWQVFKPRPDDIIVAIMQNPAPSGGNGLSPC